VIDSKDKTIDLGEAKGLSLRHEAPMPLSLREYDQPALQVIRNTVAKGLNDNELVFFLTYCKNAGWDPFTKEIYAIPRSDGGKRTVTFQTGIDALRRRAHETQAYAGMLEPEFGPPVERRALDIDIKVPEWCKFTVFKAVAGQKVRFTFTARWTEYAPRLNDKNAFMWRKRPFGQLEKCAEAGALRRAFSEQLKGLYVHDELEGGIRPQVELDLPEEQLEPQGPQEPAGEPIPTEARVVATEAPEPAQDEQGDESPPSEEALAVFEEWREAIRQTDTKKVLASYLAPIQNDDRITDAQRHELGQLMKAQAAQLDS
jgi:phage recombination protein Bet